MSNGVPGTLGWVGVAEGGTGLFAASRMRWGAAAWGAWTRNNSAWQHKGGVCGTQHGHLGWAATGVNTVVRAFLSTEAVQ